MFCCLSYFYWLQAYLSQFLSWFLNSYQTMSCSQKSTLISGSLRFSFSRSLLRKQPKFNFYLTWRHLSIVKISTLLSEISWLNCRIFSNFGKMCTQAMSVHLWMMRISEHNAMDLITWWPTMDRKSCSNTCKITFAEKPPPNFSRQQPYSC